MVGKEMMDTTITAGTATAVETTTQSSAAATQSPSATWSFVQMNMSLLPIAQPLPVSITHRFQEGKPRTPNRKLHRRVLENASNISPRRHDLYITKRRVNGINPTEKSSPVETCKDYLAISTKQEPLSTWVPPHETAHADALPSVGALRSRSLSEDLICSNQSSASYEAYDDMRLHRSVSLSTACTYSDGRMKGKRVLELQDEERRLLPDERAAAKRIRYL